VKKGWFCAGFGNSSHSTFFAMTEYGRFSTKKSYLRIIDTSITEWKTLLPIYRLAKRQDEN